MQLPGSQCRGGGTGEAPARGLFFPDAWREFLRAIRALKNAYRAYWQTDVSLQPTDVRNDLRGQFNLQVPLADNALNQFLRRVLGVQHLDKSDEEYTLRANVRKAIGNLHKAVNSPNERP